MDNKIFLVNPSIHGEIQKTIKEKPFSTHFGFNLVHSDLVCEDEVFVMNNQPLRLEDIRPQPFTLMQTPLFVDGLALSVHANDHNVSNQKKLPDLIKQLIEGSFLPREPEEPPKKTAWRKYLEDGFFDFLNFLLDRMVDLDLIEEHNLTFNDFLEEWELMSFHFENGISISHSNEHWYGRSRTPSVRFFDSKLLVESRFSLVSRDNPDALMAWLHFIKYQKDDILKEREKNAFSST